MQLLYNKIVLSQNRDRFRTMNNLIGDCYTVAIVQHLSKDELDEVSNNINIKVI